MKAVVVFLRGANSQVNIIQDIRVKLLDVLFKLLERVAVPLLRPLDSSRFLFARSGLVL